MQEIGKAPSLRFKGFEGSWKRHLLGELYQNLRTGMTPSRGVKRFFRGDIPWITSGELNYNIITKTNEYISEEAVKETNLKLYPSGTFFIAITGLEAPGTRGKCAMNRVPATTNQSCMAFEKIPNVDSRFLFYWYTKEGTKLYYKYAQGTKQQSFNNRIVEKFVFHLPSLPEQQKIADFLTVVDTRIEQLEKKKELLEQYKKGVMQQLFSQQIRFKDENGKDFPDWEEKRSSEIFKNHSNKDHDGTLPILAITQDNGAVYRDDLDLEIKTSEASIKSYKVVEQGDFVISLRSFQGGIEFSDLLGICSPAYTILKPKIPISQDFYKHYFKKESFIRRLAKTVIGIRDGKQISYSAFSGLKLKYPKVEEQKKISDFLDSIDYKISLTATQIEKTRTFKKGLLQQMFV